MESYENIISKKDEDRFNKFCNYIHLKYEPIQKEKHAKRPDGLLKIENDIFLVEIKSLCPNEKESVRIESLKSEKLIVYSEDTHKMMYRVDNAIQKSIIQFRSIKNDCNSYKNTPTILMIFNHRGMSNSLLFDIMHKVLIGDPTIVVDKYTGHFIQSYNSNNYNDWITDKENKYSLNEIDIFGEYRLRASSGDDIICFYRNPYSKYNFNNFSSILKKYKQIYFEDWNEVNLNNDE